MRWRVWMMVAVLSACGGRPPPTPPPSLADELAEDGEGEVRIAGIPLPRLPLEVSPSDPALAAGWDRAEAALTMPSPRPPTGEAWEVESWADEELGGWMRRRAEIIGAAQRALEPARAGRPEHSVVASFLLGLAYSRFALDLRGIETPHAFAEDPERVRAFRAAMEQAAQPLWLRALDAFGSCASVASAAPAHSLARWRERCDAELRTVEPLLPD